MIDQIFSDQGWLAKQLTNYHARPGQVMMAKAVDDALTHSHHLLAEGPTGTGKSMAYGIPAVLHAYATGQTVIIATANITLQEQLYNKDFPLIAKVLDGNIETERGPVPPLRFQLLKGMGNYLCLDKLNEILDRDDNLNPDYLEIGKWAHITKTGDKSELLREYPGHVWGDVAASSEDCTKKDCRYCLDCFVFKARSSEGDAPHVIITNYHMLYTDMVVREATANQVAFLPDYNVLIMDEAHEAVDIAMAFNGFEFTISKMKWLSRALTKLESGEANALGRAINNAADRFFQQLQQNLPKYEDMVVKRPLGFDGGLVSALMDAAEFIKEEIVPNDAVTDEDRRRRARARAMMSTYLKRSREINEICNKEKLPEGKVYYLEKDEKGVKLCCKVVQVQDFLRRNIFSTKTLIAASATLSTNGNFKFIASELGLSDKEYKECQAPNPFNPERVLLVIPEGLPPPKQQDKHMEAVALTVAKVVRELEGHTMALFTSYRALNHTAKFIRGKLGTVRLLLQGEMPKSRIIEEFKKDPRSVILATSSFWQGVDIPGQALSCVVIDKFPFLPPSDPVLKYMDEKLEEQGGSAFFDYSLPKAVIALKQGVGRLIRTEEDYGVIVLGDNRIDTTGYGKQFMKALPEGCFRSEHGDLGDAKAFLKEMEASCKTQRSPT